MERDRILEEAPISPVVLTIPKLFCRYYFLLLLLIIGVCENLVF